MLRKLFKYPTDKLSAENIAVSQLSILKAVIATYSINLKSHGCKQIIERCVYNIPAPPIRNTFVICLPLLVLPYTEQDTAHSVGEVLKCVLADKN